MKTPGGFHKNQIIFEHFFFFFLHLDHIKAFSLKIEQTYMCNLRYLFQDLTACRNARRKNVFIFAVTSLSVLYAI